MPDPGTATSSQSGRHSGRAKPRERYPLSRTLFWSEIRNNTPALFFSRKFLDELVVKNGTLLYKKTDMFRIPAQAYGWPDAVIDSRDHAQCGKFNAAGHPFWFF